MIKPPRYVQHIGKAKAKPDACPVCGALSDYPTPKTTLELLKATYSRPNRVFSREVWKGYRTWFFECDHGAAMDSIVYDFNPFMAMIKSTKSWSEGKYIPIPLQFVVSN